VRALTPSVTFRRGQLAEEHKVKHIYMRANRRNKTELRKYGFTLDATWRTAKGEIRDLYLPTYDNMERVYAEVVTVKHACRPREWQASPRGASGPPTTTVATVIDREEVTHVSFRDFNPESGNSNEFKIFYRWSGALNYQPHFLQSFTL
jgi:hypothetical protein